jgi:hypothetical protein
MRFVHFYLVGYFLLVAGALLTLWVSGVLQRVSSFWIFISLFVAVGLGLMLSTTGGKRTVASE